MDILTELYFDQDRLQETGDRITEVIREKHPLHGLEDRVTLSPIRLLATIYQRQKQQE